MITNDEQAIDAIATLLGTHEDWPGADFLEIIAQVVGQVRPAVGDRTPGQFKEAFLEATGRAVPAYYDGTAEFKGETIL